MQLFSLCTCFGITIVVLSFLAACFYVSTIYCKHIEAASMDTFQSLTINSWLGKQYDSVLEVFQPREIHDQYMARNPSIVQLKTILNWFKPINYCVQCAQERTCQYGVFFPWLSRANYENINDSADNLKNNITCQGKN